MFLDLCKVPPTFPETVRVNGSKFFDTVLSLVCIVELEGEKRSIGGYNEGETTQSSYLIRVLRIIETRSFLNL